mmetsp:Transcript_1568/g.2152  ORF Transcript_1568/g.2152 Transcript_1568/m.2152 type:complete len:208 (+) Transcript_1568:146-769(+)
MLKCNLPYLIWIFVCFGCFDSFCEAYQLSDAVDMVMQTNEGIQGVLRSQLPLFGKDSFAFFTRAPDYFSFSFEEGLRPLPWVKLVDGRERYLESLEVTFSYSKSGDGAIYGISSNPIYSRQSKTNNRTGFSVKYIWVEEEKVHPRTGATVMLLSVLLASCFILFDSCCGDNSGERQKSPNNYRQEEIMNPVSYASYNQGPTIAPKWD